MGDHHELAAVTAATNKFPGCDCHKKCALSHLCKEKNPEKQKQRKTKTGMKDTDSKDALVHLQKVEEDVTRKVIELSGHGIVRIEGDWEWVCSVQGCECDSDGDEDKGSKYGEGGGNLQPLINPIIFDNDKKTVLLSLISVVMEDGKEHYLYFDSRTRGLRYATDADTGVVVDSKNVLFNKTAAFSIHVIKSIESSSVQVRIETHAIEGFYLTMGSNGELSFESPDESGGTNTFEMASFNINKQFSFSAPDPSYNSSNGEPLGQKLYLSRGPYSDGQIFSKRVPSASSASHFTVLYEE